MIFFKKHIVNITCLGLLILLSIILFELSFLYADKSYYLPIDEFLIFRGVTYILHPDSFSGFINAIVNGGFRGIDSFINKIFNNITEPGLFFNAHYYGRFTWYASALVSFLPEIFFGEKGQIIATRIFLGLPSIIAFYVISFILLKNYLLRLSSLIIFIIIPPTIFYLAIPKPDNFQLLFLTLFLVYEYKGNIKNKKHWIFIGLSMGMKITSFVYFFIWFFSFYFRSSNKSLKDKLDFFISTGKYTLLGFAIINPIFIPFLVSFLFFFNLDNKIFNYSINKVTRYLLSLIFFILSFPGFFMFIHGMAINTKHGSDNIDVNAVDWFHSIFNNWFSSSYLLLSFLIVLIFYSLFNVSKELNKKRKFSFAKKTIISSLVFLLIPILQMNRVWLHYLYVGTILLIVGLFIYYEVFFSSKISKIKNFLARFFLFGFIVLCILNLNSQFLSSINTLNSRNISSVDSSSPNIQAEEIYSEIFEYFTKVDSEKTINVSYDASLINLTLRVNSIYFFVNYGPPKWNNLNFEYLIISKYNIQKCKTISDKILEYKNCQKLLENIEKAEKSKSFEVISFDHFLIFKRLNQNLI